MPKLLELAIVAPTFNERENIRPFLDSLTKVLSGIEYEVIFVDDDSSDGTAALVRFIAAENPRVRVLQRIHRRGLASACVEGMLSTAAPYIAVMDADLQHDESILPAMLDRIKAGHLDLVVASRNIEGGSMGDFAKSRVRLSGLGRRLSKLISHCELSDPMSGFFMVDRRYFETVAHSISGVGFKILLDLVASARRPVRFAEIPYQFRTRVRGESKLDILVGLEYLQLLLDKLVGGVFPSRFIIFSLVGALGLFLHLSLLFVLLEKAHTTFPIAQTLATIVAMTLNFFLNNSITYRDRRLRGWRILAGLFSFYAACAVGAVINVRIAELIRNAGSSLYLAGVVGLFIGSVWNYGATTVFTWRQHQRAVRRRQSFTTAAEQAKTMARS
jgi:dolichol-phosphate mannosyltransferase